MAEDWSNTYHFSGTTPSNLAGWQTLADAIIAEQKKCFSAGTTFVKAYGYEAGNDNSVAQIDYTVSPLTPAIGSATLSSGTAAPGDAAATMRWYTGASSSRGKRIYARKYFHGVFGTTTNMDFVLPAQKTLFETFGAKLIDGTLPGSFKYCGPQGAVLSAPQCNQYITTRTLKRRGKRPPT